MRHKVKIFLFSVVLIFTNSVSQPLEANIFSHSPGDLAFERLSNLKFNIVESSAPIKVMSEEIIWSSDEISLEAAVWHRMRIEVEISPESIPVRIDILDEENSAIFSHLFNPLESPNSEIWSPYIESTSYRIRFKAEASGSLSSLGVRLTDRSAAIEKKTQDVLYQSGRESVVGAAAWRTLDDARDMEIDRKLNKWASGVVRLKVRNPICDEFGEVTDHIAGCTAFRVSDTLFATAWHCMSDARSGCEHTSLQFGYRTQQTRNLTVETHDFSEGCRRTVYSNKNLDFVIFESEKVHYEKWKDSNVFELLDSPNGYPKAYERLAILHYPSNSRACGVANEISQGRQVGLRVSQFTDGQEGLGCVALKRKRRVKMGYSENSSSACQAIAGPSLAFGHKCATCSGSSGATIVSLLPGEREGKVVGIHHFGKSASQGFTGYNRAIRSSAIADCIDPTELFESGKISIRDNGATQNYCGCTHSDGC